MSNQMKPLQDLTLLDRFLFSAAMDNTEFAEDVFSIIMGTDISLKGIPQTEKEQRTHNLRKHIKLDVWAIDDEDNIFDAEVQKKNTKNLPKRSRYYQALMDSNLIAIGDTDYNMLNKVHIIIISPFDLFGKGRYCYTFRMNCVEDSSIDLNDDAIRIFLNTRGTDDENISNELKNMLYYFEHPTYKSATMSNSSRILRMHKHVESLKNNEELGVRYMREWEEKLFAKQEAREEGLREGRLEGIREGKLEGRLEGRLEGQEQLSTLIKKLLLENRIDDIKKVTESSEYREKLLKEYGL